jgi:hypothetical protein
VRAWHDDELHGEPGARCFRCGRPRRRGGQASPWLCSRCDARAEKRRVHAERAGLQPLVAGPAGRMVRVLAPGSCNRCYAAQAAKGRKQCVGCLARGRNRSRAERVKRRAM